MMKKKVLRLLSLLLSALVLIASGGVNVFEHHCNKTGFISTSLILNSNECHHKHSSCDHTKIDFDHCCEISSSSCCEDLSWFLKSVQISERTSITEFDFATFDFISSIDIQTEITENQDKKPTINSRPPPESGKSRLIKNNQLKIAHSYSFPELVA